MVIQKDFVNFLDKSVREDLKKIKLPKEVLRAIKKINEIRKSIVPEKIDGYLVPALLQKQTEINGLKYAIARNLSYLKGSQSHAFIFRKFQAASEYNPTKERLSNKHPDTKPTVDEINSEIEQKIMEIRRTEIAYQVACDKLECILDWCDKMIMVIQNKLRDENTDKRTTYASNNPPKFN